MREPLRALAVANGRYWSTVAPHAQQELHRWRQPAMQIADGSLRELALGKLDCERFNAEVAATLATLAPRARRRQVVGAIVALELLFDYLDGRTEDLAADPLEQGQLLFQPLIDSIGLTDGHGVVPAEPSADGRPADWRYLSALSERTRRGLFALPAASTVVEFARTAAVRCAQAQTHLHASARLGEEQLHDWARDRARGSGLEWREYTAACASSVLAMHALIAAAAEPACSKDDAKRIDFAYMAIGAVITILDSVVDEREDRARGDTGFIRLYEPGELAESVRVLIREAIARVREAPRGAHHEMTLAGVAAYYTTHPGAREPQARQIASIVHGELSPTIWPALAVMHTWRAAKTAYARLETRQTGRAGSVERETANSA